MKCLLQFRKKFKIMGGKWSDIFSWTVLTFLIIFSFWISFIVIPQLNQEITYCSQYLDDQESLKKVVVDKEGNNFIIGDIWAVNSKINDTWPIYSTLKPLPNENQFMKAPLFVAKFSPDMNLLWSRVIGDVNRFSEAKTTPDDGLVLLFITNQDNYSDLANSYGKRTDDYNVNPVVLKLDKNGYVDFIDSFYANSFAKPNLQVDQISGNILISFSGILNYKPQSSFGFGSSSYGSGRTILLLDRNGVPIVDYVFNYDIAVYRVAISKDTISLFVNMTFSQLILNQLVPQGYNILQFSLVDKFKLQFSQITLGKKEEKWIHTSVMSTNETFSYVALHTNDTLFVHGMNNFSQSAELYFDLNYFDLNDKSVSFKIIDNLIIFSAISEYPIPVKFSSAFNLTEMKWDGTNYFFVLKLNPNLEGDGIFGRIPSYSSFSYTFDDKFDATYKNGVYVIAGLGSKLPFNSPSAYQSKTFGTYDPYLVNYSETGQQYASFFGVKRTFATLCY